MKTFEDILSYHTGYTIEELTERKTEPLLEAYDVILAFKEMQKQGQTLPLDIVSVSSLKVCTGCGTTNNEPIGINKKTGKPYLACCPDNNYIPLADFLKHSIYSR